MRGKYPAPPIVKMEMMSKEYGWTPNQVREMTKDDFDDYYDILLTKNKIQENEAKKLKRK